MRCEPDGCTIVRGELAVPLAHSFMDRSVSSLVSGRLCSRSSETAFFLMVELS